MPIFTRLLFILLIMTGCSSSQRTTISPEKDEGFLTELAKLAGGTVPKGSTQKLPEQYKVLQQQHLNNIIRLQNSNQHTRFLSIVQEYTALQKLYTAAAQASCCSAAIAAVNYDAMLSAARETGAAWYYKLAEELSADTSVTSIRNAYADFGFAEACLPGYRDALRQQTQLYDDNVFVVAFHPVEDSLFFTEKNFPGRLYGFTNTLFINDMIREIDTNKSKIPFLHLTRYQDGGAASRVPDWIVNIQLPAFRATAGVETRTERRTERMEIGQDSSGRPVYSYRTVEDITTFDRVNDAQVVLELTITNPATNFPVMSRIIEKTYRPDQQRGFNPISESNKILPVREAVVRELCRDIYKEYSHLMRYVLEQ